MRGRCGVICWEAGSQPAISYLFVVLLEVSELLTQGFVLNLQVSAAQGDFIQDPAQPVDVSLDALVQGQLIFVPSKVSGIFPVGLMVGDSHRSWLYSGLLEWQIWPLFVTSLK